MGHGTRRSFVVSMCLRCVCSLQWPFQPLKGLGEKMGGNIATILQQAPFLKQSQAENKKSRGTPHQGIHITNGIPNTEQK